MMGDVHQAPSGSRSHELQDIDPKTGARVDVKSQEPERDIQELDESEGQVTIAPVETAQELVSSVLHLEDDPTMNPVTFRTIFLGM